MKIEGVCHCGDIAYQAEVDPDTARICHCTDCQTLSGSAYRANISAPANSFVLLRGKPRIYIKTTESGVKRVHAFCGNCGTPIYAAAVDNPPAYSLRIGASSSAPSCVRGAKSGAGPHCLGRWIWTVWKSLIGSESCCLRSGKRLII